jgi:hypothetical protein
MHPNANQPQEFNPRKIYETLTKLGTEWADAQATSELLDETRKSVLAQLANESNESSMAAKENYALRHEEYRRHLEAMVNAKKVANRARVKYDSAKVYVELLRTKEANERAANKFST